MKRCQLRALRAGLSLVEVLIAISLIGILAAAVLVRWEPALHDQLQGAAQVVSADLAYTRNLAVNYSSNYKLAFDLNANQYVLTHSGTDPSLNVLPPSSFRSPDDSPTEQTTDLSSLPASSGVVELAAVRRLAAISADVTNVEFGPLGSTTRPEPTVIWLAAGHGSARIYLSVTVDPTTGLTTTSEVQAVSPVVEQVESVGGP